MKSDDELKAEFLAKQGATVCKPYDARPTRLKGIRGYLDYMAVIGGVVNANKNEAQSSIERSHKDEKEKSE